MTSILPGGIAGDQLRSLVERIERVEEEIAGLNANKRDIYAEEKGDELDVRVLKRVVRLRGQDRAEREEQEALLDLYMHALGMIEAEPRAPVQAHARETDHQVDPPPAVSAGVPSDGPANHGSEPEGAKSEAVAAASSARARESEVLACGHSEQVAADGAGDQRRWHAAPAPPPEPDLNIPGFLRRAPAVSPAPAERMPAA